ncbi:MAG: helix-turn-helix transcriptional regulator [Bacilli bacterium]|nr:helix-turn-helix transcriptional regulator [Bacilli bacterium]
MNDELKIEIGKRLDNIRKNKLEISKREFAKKINMQEQNFWKLLKGRTSLSIDKLIMLHDELGFSSDYILFGEGNIKGIREIKETITSVLLNYEGENLDIAMEIVKEILNKINCQYSVENDFTRQN